MNRQRISLAEGTFLALLAATTMLTPGSASAQSVAPGEPSARPPIAIAENSGEAKPNPDKLVPSAESAPLPAPAADAKSAAPLAPAVTVAPPTTEPTATVATAA